MKRISVLTLICSLLVGTSVLAKEGANDSGEARGAGYMVRLRNLEEEVGTLKDRIFRSKARLLMMRETVMQARSTGAKAHIIHRNEVDGELHLKEMHYALDGAPIKSMTGKELQNTREIELFSGSIVPGNHNLSVELIFRGHGFGVFSYMKDYRFTLHSSYVFTADEGKAITLVSVAHERGGLTTEVTERPSVRFEAKVEEAVAAPTSASKATK